MPLLEGGAICSELSRSLPSPLGLLFLAIFGQKPVDGLARQEYGRVQGKRPQERHLDTPHKHPGPSARRLFIAQSNNPLYVPGGKACIRDLMTSRGYVATH